MAFDTVLAYVPPDYGGALCPEHHARAFPDHRADECACAVVFDGESDQHLPDGLTCDIDGAVIIEDDLCPNAGGQYGDCIASKRDHPDYTYGDHTERQVCPDAPTFTIRVVQGGDRWRSDPFAQVSVVEIIVPADTADAALDEATSAYAIATLTIVEEAAA